MPPEGRAQARRDGWLDRSRYAVDCPGDRLLDVSFHRFKAVSALP